MSQKYSLTATTILIMLAIPTQSRCAELVLEPRMSAGEEYNDNLFMRPNDNKLEVWKTTVTPSIDLAYERDDFRLRGLFLAAIKRLINNSDLNTEDQIYRINSTYRQDRLNWNLGFSYIKEATYRTELLDTGFLGVARQRKTFSVSPNWTYLLSERSKFKFGYNFLRRSYTDEGSAQPLVGSDSHSARLGLTHQLTTETEVGSTFLYRYSKSDNDFVSNVYSLVFPINHEFSETFRGTFSAGVNYAHVENANEQTDDNLGYFLGLNARKAWELGSAALSLSHDIRPSGIGTIRQYSVARVSLARELTENLVARVGMQYIKNARIGDESVSGPQRDRDYYEIHPELIWHWTEDWTFSAGYSFRSSKRPDEDSRYGNAVLFGISYHLPEVAQSW